VDIGPLFQTPAEAAKQAIENDVHILGVSSQRQDIKPCPSSDSRVEKYGRDIMVVVEELFLRRIISPSLVLEQKSAMLL
jgi:methylmalonyl-CoA mutase